jgi:hypothetical protein
MLALVLLVVVLLAPVGAEATVLYFSGFEQGAGSVSNGDVFALPVDATLQTNIVHGGARALQNLSSQTTLINTLNTATIGCRFYFRPSAQASSTGAIRFRDSGSVVGYSALYDGTHMAISGSFGGFSTTTGTATLTPGTWYRIDVVYDVAAGGVGKLYVNNVLDITTTHTGTNSNVQNIVVNGSTTSHYFDDFFCQDGTSQPPDGRTMARQVISTTPIDNAWTKSTGSTIDTVWSDTPLDTTTSANSGSTTASVSQTGVVSPFSAGQTNHGNDALNSIATINSVKIDLVGVTSATTSGGASAFLRYYVNAVGPTEVALTFTAANKNFEFILPTDTPTNLSLYQIGVRKDTSALARTQTVYDIWMQIDYLQPKLQIKTSNSKLFSVTAGTGKLQTKN